MSEWGTGKVTGGKLYCRKQPINNYAYWGRFDNNAIIPIKLYDNTWYETYWNGDTTKVGYVKKEFITNENWDGGSSGSNSLTAGHYVQVSSAYNSVNVRASMSTGSTLRGVLLSGTKVICTEVPSSEWVKIIWGGTGSSTAYVKSQYLVDGGSAPSSKKSRAKAIALSMANKNYPYNGNVGNLGLTASQWCVQYLSWLMKAAGCSSYPDFSSQATVSGAISFFGSSFGTVANGRTPNIGDWVMYSKSGETYAHVGLIVNKSGNNITTVEGNVSSTIKKKGPYNYLNGIDNFTVYGFATPTWS